MHVFEDTVKHSVYIKNIEKLRLQF